MKVEDIDNQKVNVLFARVIWYLRLHQLGVYTYVKHELSLF